jgi:hypothetical protein
VDVYLTGRALLHAKPHTTDNHVLPFASFIVRRGDFASMQDSSTNSIVQLYFKSHHSTPTLAHPSNCKILASAALVFCSVRANKPHSVGPNSQCLHMLKVEGSYVVWNILLFVICLFGGQRCHEGRHATVQLHMGCRTPHSSIVAPVQIKAQASTNRARPLVVDCASLV